MTRSAFHIVAVAVGIAAASASVVVRQEECRAVGVRCAGADGQPFVPYDRCCDGLSCMGAGTDYGLFCIDVENPGDFTVTAVPVQVSEDDEAATEDAGTAAPATTEAAAGMASDGEEETVTTVPATAGEAEDADDDEEGSAAPTVGGATTTTEEATTEEPTTEEPTSGETATEDSSADETSEDDDGTSPLAGSLTDDDDDDDDDEEADASDEDDDDLAADASDDEDEDEDSTLGGKTTATDEDDGNSVCFPAGATVELENGKVVSMDSLSIGDVVKVGVNQYSRVFMFTHKMADVMHKFVTLETESGASLSLTDGHYLYVNGALTAAKTVEVGDVLTLGNGESSAVVAVGSTSGTGLFNPQTVDGNVVVDGVLASTYTTAVEPSFAHAILAPFRMLNNFGLQFTALESGGGIFADVAPRGQAAF